MRPIFVSVVLSAGLCACASELPEYDGSVSTLRIPPPTVLAIQATSTLAIVRVCSTLVMGTVIVATPQGALVGPSQLPLMPAVPGHCDQSESSEATFLWLGTQPRISWTLSGDQSAGMFVDMPGIIRGVTVDASVSPINWYASGDAGVQALVSVFVQAVTDSPGVFPNGAPVPDASVFLQAEPGLVIMQPQNTDQNGTTAFLISVMDGRQHASLAAVVDGRLRSQPFAIQTPAGIDASTDGR